MADTFQLLALVHILLCCEALHFRKMEFAVQWIVNPSVVRSIFLYFTRNNYLEVVLCPYGQHLIVLKADGYPLYQLLPIEFTTPITGDTWQGQALIPWTYFPPNVNKMSYYASHGRQNRTHEALYPVSKEDVVGGLYPDGIHQDYFQNFRLQSIMGEDWV